MSRTADRQAGAPAAFRPPLPGPVESVALDRLSGARLTFTGRLVACHATALPWAGGLTLRLWQKHKGGYVADFQLLVGGGLRPHAAATETLEDMVCLLEDCCTRLPEPTLQGDSFEETLFAAHRTLTYRTAFLALTGDALADWLDLEEGPPPGRGASKKQRTRATA